MGLSPQHEGIHPASRPVTYPETHNKFGQFALLMHGPNISSGGENAILKILRHCAGPSSRNSHFPSTSINELWPTSLVAYLWMQPGHATAHLS